MPRIGPGRPRRRPDSISADKAYSSRENRRYLRRRKISHTIPEPRDQRANRHRRGSAGGRPTGFDAERYKKTQRGRAGDQPLKNFRAMATATDKRAYIYLGTITVATQTIWLRTLIQETGPSGETVARSGSRSPPGPRAPR
ncbi:hypothetical protein GCM10018952_60260 [Streptosporangium vulgare]